MKRLLILSKENMFKIRYTTQAEIDLQDAISYIAKESVSTAMDYLSGYEDKIELLQHNPYMGINCKRKLIRRECRVLIYQSHMIIYSIHKSKNEILLIRLYHGSEDYVNKFTMKD